MTTMNTEFMSKAKEEFVQALRGAIDEMRADAEGHEAKAAELREKADAKEQEIKYIAGFVGQIEGFIEYVENLETALEQSKEAAKDDTKEVLTFLREKGVSETYINEAMQLAGIDEDTTTEPISATG